MKLSIFNIKRQSSHIQVIYILMALIFASLLGLKATELIKSGPRIDNELIAPESLSPIGQKALEIATRTCESKVLSKNPLIASLSEPDQAAVESAHRLYCDQRLKGAEKQSEQNWLKQLPYIAEDTAAWRGRFVHHYSTILFPFRQILAGQFSYAFTSQYGFISLIPLLLVQHAPFVYYGAFGLMLLLIIGEYFLYKYRGSSNELLIIGGVLILIALISYVPAIRLAPGFAIMRYLPLVALLALAHLQLTHPRYMYLPLALILALLNSMQFNILFIVISSVGYLLVAILQRERVGMSLYFLPAVVLVVVILQGVLYVSQANMFTPNLFSSVGEGKGSLLHLAEILLFPLVCMVASFVPALNGGNTNKPSFGGHEVLALLSYGFCATYSISFMESPQHYAGFLVMSSIGIFMLMKSYCQTKLMIALALSLLLVAPINYRYISLGKKVFLSQSQLFEYKNDLGTPIFFRTSLEIEALNKDFNEITGSFQGKGKIYFISKDKIFLETFLGVNIEPFIYDVFTNFKKINPIEVKKNLKTEEVLFLVLDNPMLRAFSNNHAIYFKNQIGQGEIQSLKNILNNIEDIEYLLNFDLIKCNKRYCIYKI